MKLKNIEIELQQWGEYKGKYLGKISYEGQTGEVVMTLDHKVSEALLVCIGEVITRFATDACKELEKSIAQSLKEARNQKQIEA